MPKVWKASYNRRRYLAAREFLDDLKRNTPCMDCGQKFPPVCMDFDHPNDDKLTSADGKRRYSPSSMWGFPLEKIRQEVAKCDIVCANCHRLRTVERNKAKNA